MQHGHTISPAHISWAHHPEGLGAPSPTKHHGTAPAAGQPGAATPATATHASGRAGAADHLGSFAAATHTSGGAGGDHVAYLGLPLVPAPDGLTQHAGGSWSWATSAPQAAPQEWGLRPHTTASHTSHAPTAPRPASVAVPVVLAAAASPPRATTHTASPPRVASLVNHSPPRASSPTASPQQAMDVIMGGGLPLQAVRGGVSGGGDVGGRGGASGAGVTSGGGGVEGPPARGSSSSSFLTLAHAHAARLRQLSQLSYSGSLQ